MHYQHDPRHANNALRAVRSEGLFWNAVRSENNLLAGIDVGFDYVKDFAAHSIADVRTHLDSTAHFAADPNADALAKRFLLAYRLRNETSPSFRPTDPGMVAYAAEFRTWLLQTILCSYLFFRNTGQATF